jgi:hypothetical protein
MRYRHRYDIIIFFCGQQHSGRLQPFGHELRLSSQHNDVLYDGFLLSLKQIGCSAAEVPAHAVM